MKTEELIGMQEDELLDLLLLPKRLAYAEEEILVSAELGVRNLSPEQKTLFQHLMPAARRRYNYRVCSLNGST